VARKKSVGEQSAPTQKPSLLMSRNDVAQALRSRIDKGRTIQNTNVQSIEQLDGLRAEQNKWNDYNIEYLSRSFDVSSISKSHSNLSGWGALVMNASRNQRVRSFKDGIGKQINSFESILERLELIPEATSISSTNISSRPLPIGDINSVFIVHGHDETTKINVARFVEKLGLKAIILHEQPNKGQTIIEKFESSAAEVGFAIVLLTPDDIAASKESPDDTMFRARQNVVLELGYFCGVLGRNKVCVLFKGDVEILSDYLGVIYTPLDSDDGWHLKLAKEMKEAGLNIDLNDVL
jgi:predicted nucleotide-binding protein